MPHVPSTLTRPLALALALVLALALALAVPLAHAEPPELPSLTCTVTLQELGAGMRLRIRFDNPGATPLELPPGPQLVLYADATARERLDAAARLDRLQRAPLVVPPQNAVESLFVVAPAELGGLQCAPSRPAAAAMYFYRFSQRPQSRCILRGLDLLALACPSPPAPGASAPS